MNVKELKEVLANLPDDMQVILQIDPEGNGYHTLYCADPDSIAIMDERGYRPEEVYSLEWTAEDCCLEEEVWEQMKKEYPRVLVLAP